jgi:putative lipase involved disintegration of autophagic bodies
MQLLVWALAAWLGLASSLPWDVTLSPLQEDADDEQFREVISPLSIMTKMTYTATHGTYFNPKANATVVGEGWHLSSLLHNPVRGGMRALLFYSTDLSRAVIAFRGTDLGSSGVDVSSGSRQDPVWASMTADECANLVLWHGASRKQLPDKCGSFSDNELDYLSRAADFVTLASQALQSIQATHWEILFTGHSLGAGLASLMGATQGGMLLTGRPNTVALSATASCVLAFSSGNVSTILLNRSSVRSGSVNVSQVYILADRWDPVYRGSAGDLDATVCLWASTETESCTTCYAKDEASDDMDMEKDEACDTCFLTHHIYAHYLELVASSARPTCHIETGGDQTAPSKEWWMLLFGACLVSLMAGAGGCISFWCFGIFMPQSNDARPVSRM